MFTNAIITCFPVLSPRPFLFIKTKTMTKTLLFKTETKTKTLLFKTKTKTLSFKIKTKTFA